MVAKTSWYLIGIIMVMLAQNQSPIDSKKLAVSAEQSVVKIVFINPAGQLNSIGTGFFVKDNLIATASHVYLDGEKTVVDNGGGQLLVGKVFHAGSRFLIPFQLAETDYGHDLALLRIDPSLIKQQRPDFEIKPLELEDAKPSVGDGLMFMGYFGNDDFPLLSRTILSGFTVGASEQLVLDLPANPGQSGSPVLSLDSGKVIGVLSSFVAVTLFPGTPATHSGLSRSVEAEHLKKLIGSAEVR